MPGTNGVFIQLFAPKGNTAGFVMELIFFTQALLGGFSFPAGEHTTSAVREIGGPTQI